MRLTGATVCLQSRAMRKGIWPISHPWCPLCDDRTQWVFLVQMFTGRERHKIQGNDSYNRKRAIMMNCMSRFETNPKPRGYHYLICIGEGERGFRGTRGIGVKEKERSCFAFLWHLSLSVPAVFLHVVILGVTLVPLFAGIIVLACLLLFNRCLAGFMF